MSNVVIVPLYSFNVLISTLNSCIVRLLIRKQCRTQGIFGDTVYSCYCKLRLVTPPPWWGLTGGKFWILMILDRWKRHFRKKNYIRNYFSKLLKKYYIGVFFWAPIPHKWYQNTSGFAGGKKRMTDLVCIFKKYWLRGEVVFSVVKSNIQIKIQNVF